MKVRKGGKKVLADPDRGHRDFAALKIRGFAINRNLRFALTSASQDSADWGGFGAEAG